MLIPTKITEDHKEFLKLVGSMRSLQKKYFKTRLQSVLVEAVQEERKVDEYLQALEINLLSSSPNLFNLE